jgi:hypothetical protein
MANPPAQKRLCISSDIGIGLACIVVHRYLARRLGIAVILSRKLRQLGRDLWVARCCDRPDDVDVAVHDCHYLGHGAEF